MSTQNLERRRQYDIELNEIEKSIIELHATVHNGLSDRSKENLKLVKELTKQHREFEKDFAIHCAQDTALHEALDMRLSEMQFDIKNIVDTQNKWNRIFFGVALAGIGALCSLVYWLIINVQEIAKFMEHIQ